MRIFDPHMHMISRVTDDYERMALCGIERIVEPAFWLGQPRTHAGTFFDYFRHIMEFETERAARYGIDHYCTLAVNPREANNVRLADEVVKGLPQFLAHPRVVAVGEIGFDDITDAEERCIVKHLELAARMRLPVLVHLPHRDKLKGTLRTIQVLKDMKYDMDSVILDHNTEETIGPARESGAWCGHTVYPVTKLSPDRAANIFEEHGVEKMLVNAAADWGPSDPLMVPRTVVEMRKRKRFTPGQIETLVWRNPHVFFGKSGKLPSP
jgi:predicted metal-dependent TIM-barrel fold hydrolase